MIFWNARVVVKFLLVVRMMVLRNMVAYLTVWLWRDWALWWGRVAYRGHDDVMTWD